jgi:RNA polymerase sigma-70 factor (ECF subfamily)
MHERDSADVARARAGDQGSFQALVERHSRSVFRLAFRMTGNEQDAEDVVQEAFLRAFQQLERFEARSAFGTWMYRITANCAVDLLRGRRRHTSEMESLDDDESTFDRQLSSASPAPDRLALSAEVRDEVGQLLEKLSPLERAAFVLRHLEGRSIDEVGRFLDLGESAAKHRIFRAVRKMRRGLAAYAGARS